VEVVDLKERGGNMVGENKKKHQGEFLKALTKIYAKLINRY